jgi:transcriptional regulator
MYTPSHFVEDRIEVLHELMRTHTLAALVTNTASGLVASHIPLLLDASAGPYGTLRGHVARSNPQWRDAAADQEALVIFSGPQHYISPSWYPSKTEHGRVVPTWNYVVVHAYGRLTTYDDPGRLYRHVAEMTSTQEPRVGGDWKIEDAPEEYTRALVKAIVGIEIEITRLEGKWKVSQNRPENDRVAVSSALSALGSDESAVMSQLIKETTTDGG